MTIIFISLPPTPVMGMELCKPQTPSLPHSQNRAPAQHFLPTSPQEVPPALRVCCVFAHIIMMDVQEHLLYIKIQFPCYSLTQGMY